MGNYLAYINKKNPVCIFMPIGFYQLLMKCHSKVLSPSRNNAEWLSNCNYVLHSKNGSHTQHHFSCFNKTG